MNAERGVSTTMFSALVNLQGPRSVCRFDSFKLPKYSLWAFGRTVIKREPAGAGSVIGNIIWIVLAGWWLAISPIVTAAALAITIIGIPLAIANIKLVPVALWPFGREIVETDEVVGAFTASR